MVSYLPVIQCEKYPTMHHIAETYLRYMIYCRRLTSPPGLIPAAVYQPNEFTPPSHPNDADEYGNRSTMSANHLNNRYGT